MGIGEEKKYTRMTVSYPCLAFARRGALASHTMWYLARRGLALEIGLALVGFSFVFAFPRHGSLSVLPWLPPVPLGCLPALSRRLHVRDLLGWGAGVRLVRRV